MVQIETPEGIYEIRVPTGILGAQHIAMLTKIAGDTGIDMDRFPDVYVQWCTEILSKIVISGPHKFEDMPSTDQFMIFMLLYDMIKVDKTRFRIIE